MVIQEGKCYVGSDNDGMIKMIFQESILIAGSCIMTEHNMTLYNVI